MMNRPFFRPPKSASLAGRGDASGLSNTNLTIDLDELRRRILNAVLTGAMFLGLVALIGSVPERLKQGEVSLAIILIVAFVILLILGLGRKLPYRVRTTGLLLLVAMVGTVTLVGDGLYGNGRLYFILLPILAGMLLGGRPGLVIFGLTVAALIIVGVLLLTGGLPMPVIIQGVGPGGANSSVSYWILAITTYAMLGGVISLSLYSLLKGLTENLQQARRLAIQLDAERSQLEHRVLSRTQDLERRLVQIRTAAEISRSITVSFLGKSLGASAAGYESVTMSEDGAVPVPTQAQSAEGLQAELLKRVVELVRDRFELYYVGVFLLDERGENAVLRAGTGEAGERMLASSHALPVNDSSMIGWSIHHRQARIALDVASASTPLDTADRHKRADVTITRFNNPLLPQTRSELALPMVSGETVVGAMTVQSELSRAFDQDDITVLQSIADTLTAALDNVRLFHQTQQNLSEIQSLNRQYFVEAWSSASRLPEFRAYEYVASKSPALDRLSEQLPVGPEPGSPELDGELETTQEAQAGVEQPVVQTYSQEIPLTLREQLIGSLAIERDKPLSPEEQSLVDAVATEAALALENVRLLEQSQRRAGQERLLSEIARQVRGTTDIDSILRYTVRELGQALSASSALIRLGGGLEAAPAVTLPDAPAPTGVSTVPLPPETELTDQPDGDETKGEESDEC